MDLDSALDGAGRHGLAAAVVGGAGGDVVHLRGGASVSDSFEWGSVTKTVTGTLLALLAAHGVVRLDQPLGSLFPGAPDIPLEALASHTSGLPRLLPSSLRFMWATRSAGRDPYAGQGEAEVLAALARTRLRSPKVRYSNAGAALLGLALTRATGSTYERLVAEHVAGPLGLSSVTTLDRDGLLQGHDRRGRPVPHWHFQDAMVGCGGLRGSVTDLARWATAVGGDAPEPLATALREAVRSRATTRTSEVGLGWHRSALGGSAGLRAPRTDEPALRWHNGGTAGFRSFVGWDEGSGRGVAVLAARPAPVDGLAIQLLRPART